MCVPQSYACRDTGKGLTLEANIDENVENQLGGKMGLGTVGKKRRAYRKLLKSKANGDQP